MSGFQVDRRRALAFGLSGTALLAVPSWAWAAELDEAGIDAPETASARVLMRLNACDGAAPWSNGASIEIGIGGNDAVAFLQTGV